MLDVDEILKMHESMVASWHEQPIANSYSGPMELICQQHIYNFELWHQEDVARSPNASDSEIAKVKRNIDRLNQARNDYIEKIDDWITHSLSHRQVALSPSASQRTETPGSAIDRLSILALRIFHYREQCQRDGTDSTHQQKVASRLAICIEQRSDLSQSLKELLSEIASGRVRHKTYRQMKMYNDPTLNPFLYTDGSQKA
jgi:Protein of unknown function (DUF4254)